MKGDEFFGGHPSVPVVLAHQLSPGPCYLHALNQTNPSPLANLIGLEPSLSWSKGGGEQPITLKVVLLWKIGYWGIIFVWVMIGMLEYTDRQEQSHILYTDVIEAAFKGVVDSSILVKPAKVQDHNTEGQWLWMKL